MDALIAVDVQNDFCAGGALAVPDGDAVVEPLNQLIAQADFVVATRDWHPRDHGSFATAGGPWPQHCIAETTGAQLHPQLERERVDAIVDKGRRPGEEGYSGFEDTDLEQLLRGRGIDTVHIGGLALDYCVRATALDARRLGFDVVLHRGATRAVDLQPGDGERALHELRAAGVTIIE